MDKLYHVQCRKHYIDDNNYKTSDKEESFLVHASYPVESIEKAIVADGGSIADYPVFTETILSSKPNRWGEYYEYEATEIDLSMDVIYL